MNLYEFEGKDLLKSVGISVPQSQLITSSENISIKLTGEVVVKAQVLSGKRFKRGLVKLVGASVAKIVVEELFNRGVVDGEKITKVLVEEKITGKEQFLSITYDTEMRGPVILYSNKGGVDVEGAEFVSKVPVDPKSETLKLDPIEFNPSEDAEFIKLANKLWKLFIDKDLRLAEINPLLKTDQGFVAADAKIIIDDDALYRHEEFKDYPPRQLIGHEKTNREVAANKIDETDYRGTAGSVYYDLEGDIAVLASGGGASVVAMDALLALGGKPANYTEYSGNPPREKVEKLTTVVLGKEGLKGCWVVGGTANFTDIYDTLSGFLDGLRKITPKPTYPIVIRRGGPRDSEAFKMLKEAGEKENWDFHIYGPETPMTETAQIMVDLINDREKE